MNINRVPEGIEDARRAVGLARKTGYLAGEALALANLSLGAYYAGDLQNALACARQARHIDPAGIPGWIARRCNDFLIMVLLETGDLSSMDQQAGLIPEAGRHLRETLELATLIGDPLRLLNCLDSGGHLGAATQRWAQVVTVWAALDAQTKAQGIIALSAPTSTASATNRMSAPCRPDPAGPASGPRLACAAGRFRPAVGRLSRHRCFEEWVVRPLPRRYRYQSACLLTAGTPQREPSRQAKRFEFIICTPRDITTGCPSGRRS
jgi:hypothetical protein